MVSRDFPFPSTNTEISSSLCLGQSASFGGEWEAGDHLPVGVGVVSSGILLNTIRSQHENREVLNYFLFRSLIDNDAFWTSNCVHCVVFLLSLILISVFFFLISPHKKSNERKRTKLLIYSTNSEQKKMYKEFMSWQPQSAK